MKMQTTIKNVKNNAKNLVYIPYGGASNLLQTTEPIAYTKGVYGWNFDVYEFDGLTICTGYRYMPGRCANNYEEYNEKAREILKSRLPYEDQKKAINQLLRKFIAQA